MTRLKQTLAISSFTIVLGFVFAFSNAQAAELSAPTIVINPDIYYPLDEILYIEGRSKPSASIELLLQKSGSKPIKAVAKSDSRGEWVFTQKLPLDDGNWEVRARVVDGEAVSEWSNPRIIKAIVTGVILGGVAVKFATLVLVIVTLLAIGGLVVFYYSRRVKAIAARYEAELREKEREALELKMDQEFSEIRQEILRELEHLEKRIEDGKFTDEEKKEALEHREALLRKLKDTERSLEEKIKDLS